MIKFLEKLMLAILLIILVTISIGIIEVPESIVINFKNLKYDIEDIIINMF